MNATTHNHETIDTTPRHVLLAEHANAIGDNVARGFGSLEASARAASAAWASVEHAARDAGDDASADYARKQSRRHWKDAERLRVVFFKSTGHTL